MLDPRLWGLTDYQPKPPTPQAGLLDEGVCQRSRCPHCGHEGLIYRPFVRPGSYRAFAVCPACGHTDEF